MAKFSAVAFRPEAYINEIINSLGGEVPSSLVPASTFHNSEAQTALFLSDLESIEGILEERHAGSIDGIIDQRSAVLTTLDQNVQTISQLKGELVNLSERLGRIQSLTSSSFEADTHYHKAKNLSEALFLLQVFNEFVLCNLVGGIALEVEFLPCTNEQLLIYRPDDYAKALADNALIPSVVMSSAHNRPARPENYFFYDPQTFFYGTLLDEKGERVRVRASKQTHAHVFESGSSGMSASAIRKKRQALSLAIDTAAPAPASASAPEGPSAAPADEFGSPDMIPFRRITTTPLEDSTFIPPAFRYLLNSPFRRHQFLRVLMLLLREVTLSDGFIVPRTSCLLDDLSECPWSLLSLPAVAALLPRELDSARLQRATRETVLFLRELMSCIVGLPSLIAHPPVDTLARRLQQVLLFGTKVCDRGAGVSPDEFRSLGHAHGLVFTEADAALPFDTASNSRSSALSVPAALPPFDTFVLRQGLLYALSQYLQPHRPPLLLQARRVVTELEAVGSRYYYIVLEGIAYFAVEALDTFLAALQTSGALEDPHTIDDIARLPPDDARLVAAKSFPSLGRYFVMLGKVVVGLMRLAHSIAWLGINKCCRHLFQFVVERSGESITRVLADLKALYTDDAAYSLFVVKILPYVKVHFKGFLSSVLDLSEKGFPALLADTSAQSFSTLSRPLVYGMWVHGSFTNPKVSFKAQVVEEVAVPMLKGVPLSRGSSLLTMLSSNKGAKGPRAGDAGAPSAPSATLADQASADLSGREEGKRASKAAAKFAGKPLAVPGGQRSPDLHSAEEPAAGPGAGTQPPDAALHALLSVEDDADYPIADFETTARVPWSVIFNDEYFDTVYWSVPEYFTMRAPSRCFDRLLTPADKASGVMDGIVDEVRARTDASGAVRDLLGACTRAFAVLQTADQGRQRVAQQNRGLEKAADGGADAVMTFDLDDIVAATEQLNEREDARSAIDALLVHTDDARLAHADLIVRFPLAEYCAAARPAVRPDTPPRKWEVGALRRALLPGLVLAPAPASAAADGSAAAPDLDAPPVTSYNLDGLDEALFRYGVTVPNARSRCLLPSLPFSLSVPAPYNVFDGVSTAMCTFDAQQDAPAYLLSVQRGNTRRMSEVVGRYLSSAGAVKAVAARIANWPVVARILSDERPPAQQESAPLALQEVYSKLGLVAEAFVTRISADYVEHETRHVERSLSSNTPMYTPVSAFPFINEAIAAHDRYGTSLFSNISLNRYCKECIAVLDRVDFMFQAVRSAGMLAARPAEPLDAGAGMGAGAGTGAVSGHYRSPSHTGSAAAFLGPWCSPASTAPGPNAAAATATATAAIPQAARYYTFGQNTVITTVNALLPLFVKFLTIRVSRSVLSLLALGAEVFRGYLPEGIQEEIIALDLDELPRGSGGVTTKMLTAVFPCSESVHADTRTSGFFRDLAALTQRYLTQTGYGLARGADRHQTASKPSLRSVVPHGKPPDDASGPPAAAVPADHQPKASAPSIPPLAASPASPGAPGSAAPRPSADPFVERRDRRNYAKLFQGLGVTEQGTPAMFGANPLYKVLLHTMYATATARPLDAGDDAQAQAQTQANAHAQAAKARRHDAPPFTAPLPSLRRMALLWDVSDYRSAKGFDDSYSFKSVTGGVVVPLCDVLIEVAMAMISNTSFMTTYLTAHLAPALATDEVSAPMLKDLRRLHAAVEISVHRLFVFYAEVVAAAARVILSTTVARTYVLDNSLERAVYRPRIGTLDLFLNYITGGLSMGTGGGPVREGKVAPNTVPDMFYDPATYVPFHVRFIVALFTNQLHILKDSTFVPDRSVCNIVLHSLVLFVHAFLCNLSRVALKPPSVIILIAEIDVYINMVQTILAEFDHAPALLQDLTRALELFSLLKTAVTATSATIDAGILALLQDYGRRFREGTILVLQILARILSAPVPVLDDGRIPAKNVRITEFPLFHTLESLLAQVFD